MAKASEKAFTLLELMTAAGILLVAILALLTVLINSMILNESNNNLVIATNDAQNVLEQIKALSYSDIASYTPPTFNNLNGESITLPTNQSIGANLWEVTVDVSWTERQRQRHFQLSTRIVRQ